MTITFPQSITTRKISRGHYHITRSDGREFEVIQGALYWFIDGHPEKGPTLSALKNEIRTGMLLADQAPPEPPDNDDDWDNWGDCNACMSTLCVEPEENVCHWCESRTPFD